MLSLRYCLIAIALCSSASSLMAQNTVDVYFIAGQSNAAILGELNSYDVEGYFLANGSVVSNAAMYNNQTEAGFDLTFARIRDRDRGSNTDDAVTDVVERFTESRLDATNYAVDSLAVQLNSEFGNDIGIFSYGRNGRPLTNLTNDSGESWFPGTVAAPFNGELYGKFQTWSADRIEEVENGQDGIAGTADDQEVVVQGILWFQGEADSDNAIGRRDYADNFSNLIERFREDFNNPDLAVVASEIRGLGTNDDLINDALNAVALADANVEVIDISDDSIYTPITVGNQHLDAVGFRPLANDFAQRLIQIQSPVVVPEPSVPEPSSSQIVAGATQRYADAATNYTLGTGWNDTAGTADTGQNGTFALTTTPNGTVAVANTGSGQDLPFSGGASLNGSGYTIQTVIRLDAGNTEARQGPIGFTDNGWSGAYLGAGDGSVLDVGAGRQGGAAGRDGGVSRVDPADGAFTVAPGTWAIYTLSAGPTGATATIDALDGSGNLFTASFDAANGSTDDYVGIGTAGVLFGGQRGTAAVSALTDGWIGAIAEVAIYETQLSAADLATNTAEFQAFFFESDEILLGDASCNGAVDFLDIAPFITLLSSGEFKAEADIDGSLVVDFLDIAPFISILSSP